MRVVFRSLLAVMFAACVSSCALNDHGLGGIDASTGRVAFDDGAAGALGAAGAQGAAGTTSPATGTAGVASLEGTAGAEAAGTSGGDTAGVGASGAAGDTTTGAAGDTTPGDAGDTTTGDAGAPFVVDASADVSSSDASDASSAGGTSGAAGSTAPPEPGCSDGTREGYLDMTKYPGIAACSGGWAEPGLDSAASHTPECDRRAGNSGDKVDGHGCSIADLCAVGWHVCESVHEVAQLASSCNDAFSPSAAKPVFFVTRQRAVGLTCTDDSQTEGGTNNIYGCGNVGSYADQTCSPFNHMLRDSDCANQPPWACSDNSQDEYLVVTKLGSTRGGALCCKD